MNSSLALGILLSLGLLLFLISTGARIFACMIIAGITASYFLLGNVKMLSFIPFTAANSWSLAAMPLFVFMGGICLHGGISDGLYKGASSLLRGLRGGLLHSNIVACALFSAISGSTTATAVTVGSIAIPELNKRGYSDPITTGSLAAGSILGSMIPPSTVFIIYGFMTNTSIGKLFMAGLVPGICLALLYMVVIVLWVTIKPNVAPKETKTDLKTMFKDIKGLIPILVISGIVLGGIYFGVFTPVEGGAVGCVTAVIVSLVMRRLSWEGIRKAAMATIKTTTFLMMIIVGSSILSNVLAALRIPFHIASWIISLQISPMAILFGFVIMYLVFGCVIESLPVLIMTLPIVFPVIKELGFDPIWFGVIVTLLTQIAMITPPVGVSLYAIHGLSNRGSQMDVILGTLPFLGAALLMVAIVILFPPLSTWLPGFMIE